MADTFTALGVPADLIPGLEELGIHQPTPIQQQVIPFLMKDGSDLIAQAQTGTGKTAAFGLPLLAKIDPDTPVIQGLIIAPTRELAKQIGKQLFRYTKHAKSKLFIEVAAGGDKIELQAQRLQRATHIVVATPGRLMDLLEAKAIALDSVKYLVLDEADEMLSMGFKKELATIFAQTKKRKATWLFSATFQKRVEGLIEDNLSPKAYRVKVAKAQVVNPNIDHQFAVCAREEKDEFIVQYLKAQGDARGLIFCRTRAGSIRLGEELTKKGMAVAVLQGDLSQRDRDKVMRSFKNERTQFLIATDVAARGIDVEGLSFVIQHQLPDAMQYYTHRSGRTARAGKTGVSITLIEPSERSKLARLEQELGVNFTLVE
ncbi:MAG: ATP-dependent RNA helicase DeaD [Lentimonas sp.]|jgi:ATP-dependent RNA helicase DeaD